MIFILIAALVVVLLVALALAALGAQLMQQSGRILERVEALESVALERIVASAPQPQGASVGLPLNSMAPPFELPDLSGRTRSLGEWRGRRTLLVFLDTHSQYCLSLIESLRSLGTDVSSSSRPTPLIIAIGDPDEARRVLNSFGSNLPVLVHGQTQVAASYVVDAVPASYIISEDGLIAGTVAYGHQAVLVSAGETSDIATSTSASQRLATEDLTSQRGLFAGTQAPIFRLPKLGGGEVSLLEYRGKDTLLVFTDPDCEPCLDFMPELIKSLAGAPGVCRGDGQSGRRIGERRALRGGRQRHRDRAAA